ncbi:hypothetical protein [Haloarcula nitratireducens]|uniref:Uncharacterized protein n=1 Tax=Haloarcula nitratireducens TaxID=2487749 RepID=A0AAW4PB46_9EURY|nr:hypothetical protein [Halomicroarcula nitratireducens]MBX0295341.1 hypothetical protein [Halomicroarcula nitratireducens]
MLRRLRENGPVVLVPLAWTFATAAHLGLLAARTVLIAHVVMATILAAFAALSWREMADGVLLVWRRVLVVGLPITLAGIAGLLGDVEALLTATVVGWMVVPAVGLAYTGRRVDRTPWAYTGGAAASAAGVVVYLAGIALPAWVLVLVGLTLTNVGQTAGIVAAVRNY